MSSRRLHHPYHLVDVSPWPILTALASLLVTIGAVLTMHNFDMHINGNLLLKGLLFLILIVSLWFRDIIRESIFLRQNTTPAVEKGLRIGFALFILSEIMFFFAFFWAFFHSSLSPAIQIGCLWPPMGIEALSAFEVPLLNTVILLTSGMTITVVHYSIIAGQRQLTINSFLATIFLAILFTAIQVMEYIETSFNISDSVYGSIFFIATGFHGFHVLIGTIFITVNLFRYSKFHFSAEKHLGFEMSAWYWHFVDVVWLFLWACVYFWGNLQY